MPTTQKDFDALETALKNNNIEDVKKMLQDFDIDAKDKNKLTCLLLTCTYCSSCPEAVRLVFEKIDAAGGGVAMLYNQLGATDKDGSTSLMLACRNATSTEVVKLITKKMRKAGDKDMVKNHFSATGKGNLNCQMIVCSSDSSASPELMKLVAGILFYFDLFVEFHGYLSAYMKNRLKQIANIDRSWIPDDVSRAEVEELLADDDDPVARKKAEEKTALAKKKAGEQEAAAAKKKVEEKESSLQEQPSAQRQQDSQVFSYASAPPSRCFKRGVPDEDLERSVKALFSIKEAPTNRPDLGNWVPDSEDATNLLHYLNCNLAELKSRPAIKKLIAECGLTDDEIKILHSYKIQNPYPVYLWLNGWLGGDRRDDFVKEKVAPFFVLLYRAMEKLPRVKTVANRAIKVNGIPALKNTYDNHEVVCSPGKTLSFWGFSSFSTESDVINREEFVGKPSEEAILYSCGELEGVDMEPFAPKGLKDESEILPLCPCVLEVTTTIKVGKKLVVAVKQVDHANFAYVAPK